jgi:cyclophilin family peptidyl-prolyl cis-trans isomerase
LKTTITIFLVTILFAAQYAKHLSYMGCRFYNIVSDSAIKCDCEKAYSKEKSSPTDEHNNTIHKHLQIDDYVKIGAVKIATPKYLSIASILFKKFKSTIKDGFYNKPLQPPEA